MIKVRFHSGSYPLTHDSHTPKRVVALRPLHGYLATKPDLVRLFERNPTTPIWGKYDVKKVRNAKCGVSHVEIWPDPIIRVYPAHFQFQSEPNFGLVSKVRTDPDPRLSNATRPNRRT